MTNKQILLTPHTLTLQLGRDLNEYTLTQGRANVRLVPYNNFLYFAEMVTKIQERHPDLFTPLGTLLAIVAAELRAEAYILAVQPKKDKIEEEGKAETERKDALQFLNALQLLSESTTHPTFQRAGFRPLGVFTNSDHVTFEFDLTRFIDSTTPINILRQTIYAVLEHINYFLSTSMSVDGAKDNIDFHCVWPLKSQEISLAARARFLGPASFDHLSLSIATTFLERLAVRADASYSKDILHRTVRFLIYLGGPHGDFRPGRKSSTSVDGRFIFTPDLTLRKTYFENSSTNEEALKLRPLLHIYSPGGLASLPAAVFSPFPSAPVDRKIPIAVRRSDGTPVSNLATFYDGVSRRRFSTTASERNSQKYVSTLFNTHDLNPRYAYTFTLVTISYILHEDTWVPAIINVTTSYSFVSYRVYKNMEAAEKVVELLFNAQAMGKIFVTGQSQTDLLGIARLLVGLLEPKLLSIASVGQLNRQMSFRQHDGVIFSVRVTQPQNTHEITIHAVAALLPEYYCKVSKITGLDPAQCREEEEHVQRNDRRLYDTLRNFQMIVSSRFGVDPLGSSTLASLAKKIFLQLSPSFFRSERQGLSSQDEHTLRRAFRGGRCELLRHYTVAKDERIIRFLDISSFYPAIADSFALPSGYMGPASVEQCAAEVLPSGVFLCTVVATMPSTPNTPPFLPMVEGSNVLYPVGEGTASYSSIEINYARTLGNYKITVISGLIFQTGTRPFAFFIQAMAQGKSEALGHGDSLTTRTVKLLTNSLFGKLAQARLATSSQIMDCRSEAEYDRFANKGAVLQSLNSDLILVADTHEIQYRRENALPATLFITAHGRVIMHKLLAYMVSLGYCPLYVDTDSIALECNREFSLSAINKFLKKQYEKTLEGTIGQLRDVFPGTDITEAFFIAPKLYRLKTADGRRTVKSAGFGITTEARFDDQLGERGAALLHEHAGGLSPVLVATRRKEFAGGHVVGHEVALFRSLLHDGRRRRVFDATGNYQGTTPLCVKQETPAKTQSFSGLLTIVTTLKCSRVGTTIKVRGPLALKITGAFAAGFIFAATYAGWVRTSADAAIALRQQGILDGLVYQREGVMAYLPPEARAWIAGPNGRVYRFEELPGGDPQYNNNVQILLELLDSGRALPGSLNRLGLVQRGEDPNLWIVYDRQGYYPLPEDNFIVRMVEHPRAEFNAIMRQPGPTPAEMDDAYRLGTESRAGKGYGLDENNNRHWCSEQEFGTFEWNGQQVELVGDNRDSDLQHRLQRIRRLMHGSWHTPGGRERFILEPIPGGTSLARIIDTGGEFPRQIDNGRVPIQPVQQVSSALPTFSAVQPPTHDVSPPLRLTEQTPSQARTLGIPDPASQEDLLYNQSPTPDPVRDQPQEQLPRVEANSDEEAQLNVTSSHRTRNILITAGISAIFLIGLIYAGPVVLPGAGRFF